MESVKVENKKKIYIEILRIVACYLVVVCHTINILYRNTDISVSWFYGIAVYFISKIAVPIFLMISGALILSKDRSYKEIIKKAINRVLIPLVVASAVIYFKRDHTMSLGNFMNFFKSFITGDILLIYWYLYALIGMYLCSPFLRKMVNNFEDKDYKFLLGLWIIFTGVIQIIERYTEVKITSYFLLPIIGRYIPYFILGHYMINENHIKYTKKGVVILSISSIISIVVSTIITYFNYKSTSVLTMLDNVDYINLIILSFSAVYIVKYLFENHSFKEKTSKILLEIGGTTFGIYLIHGVLIDHIKIVYTFMLRYVHPIIAINIYQIVFFCVVMLITYILRKIPYVKKYL